MKPASALILSILLGGCAAGPGGPFGGLFGTRTPGASAPQVMDGGNATHPRARPGAGRRISPGASPGALPGARTPDALDTTTVEERRQAVADTGAGGEVALGTTIASLGAVGEPGIWLKTPLVSAPARGRVDYPEKGTSVALDLIPLDAAPGAGSRISLAAMRLIGADLTALPELRVYRTP